MRQHLSPKLYYKSHSYIASTYVERLIVVNPHKPVFQTDTWLRRTYNTFLSLLRKALSVSISFRLEATPILSLTDLPTPDRVLNEICA